MITIIFKIMLASGLFLLAYKFLLEKEKMHHFNRFYLLFSLLLSFVIPFLEIRISDPVSIPFENELVDTGSAKTSIISHQLVLSTEVNHWPTILWTIYGVIMISLLLRFAMNLKTIMAKISDASIVPFKNLKIVLTNEKLIPHSFLNYIFVNREEYERGSIEEEIFFHEETHARQRHTVDILLIEFVFVLFWFNPFIILYRKAIQLNHEFLADEAVIRSNHNMSAYRCLLLSKLRDQTSSVFISSFNYLATKKRLIMMTKITSRPIALGKQSTSLLLLIGAILLLSTKTHAQTKADPVVAGSNSEKMQSKQDSVVRIGEVVSHDDKYIYFYTKVDSDKYSVHKLPRPTPVAKKSPSSMQLQAWTNKDMYGVWLDGLRIPNSELSRYQPTDFAQFFESRLMKNAKNYGNYYYQINLLTSNYYEKVYKERLNAFGSPKKL